MTPEERNAFMAAMVAALKDGDHMLNEDERRWVRLAIAKEAQSFQLRQAIIEKTLGSLAWAAIVGMGYLVWNLLFPNAPRG